MQILHLNIHANVIGQLLLRVVATRSVQLFLQQDIKEGGL